MQFVTPGVRLVMQEMHPWVFALTHAQCRVTIPRLAGNGKTLAKTEVGGGEERGSRQPLLIAPSFLLSACKRKR
jgi:hypothetical protein